MRIRLDFESSSKKPETAFGKLRDSLERFRSRLSDLGFETEELRLGNIKNQSDKKYIDGKYVDDGFISKCTCAIESELDQKKVIKLFGICGSDFPELSIDIRYTVERPQDVLAAILRLAVADATEKAKILAEALNQRLGPVLSVRYDDSELSFDIEPPTDVIGGALYDSADEMPEVEEEEREEQVNIVWRLEDPV